MQTERKCMWTEGKGAGRTGQRHIHTATVETDSQREAAADDGSPPLCDDPEV